MRFANAFIDYSLEGQSEVLLYYFNGSLIVCICAQPFRSLSLSLSLCKFVCVFVCVYVCVQVCVCVCVSACVCVHVCV